MTAGIAPGWPALGGRDLKPTTDALHLWSQVVGKVRLMLTPWINHSWHVPLYLSAVGFGTGLIPAPGRSIALEFDLIAGLLVVRDTSGEVRTVTLEPRSVAGFYADTMAALQQLGLAVRLDPMPCELVEAVPFHADDSVRAYDGEVARAYWRAMIQAERVFQVFRSRFIGKCSPIHLFWGSFDLAVTRFSGRTAPRHPGGAPHLSDAVAREAYSHEVSSAGFWPGDGAVHGPSFYSYAYPAPPGFGEAPAGAGAFDAGMGEFLLSYEAVLRGLDPDAVLLDFLQSSYEAAANLAHWDRAGLERPTGLLGLPPVG
jgi:hypothetical protein